MVGLRKNLNFKADNKFVLSKGVVDVICKEYK